MYITGIDTALVIASDGIPAFKVGTRGVDSDGCEFMYVHANGVAVIGDVMGILETFEADQVTVTTSAPGTGQGISLGVAVATLADNEFGWVQIYGVVGAIKVETGAVEYTLLNTTAVVGSLDDDATTGAEEVQGLITTAAESGNLATGFLTYPYIGLTIP